MRSPALLLLRCPLTTFCIHRGTYTLATHAHRYPGFTTLLSNLLKSSVDQVADEQVEVAFLRLCTCMYGLDARSPPLYLSIRHACITKQTPQWQREYIEGSQLEVYMVRLPEAFHGLPFHQVKDDCRGAGAQR